MKPFLSACLALFACAFLAAPGWAFDPAPLSEAVRAEEKALPARIGVAVFDAASGETWAYRGGERFPLNSTHKALAAAALLARADAGQLPLDRPVAIPAAALVAYSPVVEKHLAPQTLTLGQLAGAAVSESDNTAANAVLDAVGGPAALTAWLRGLGDETTRLDRREPELNEGTPGDPRDTTTPAAMARTLRKILLGDALTPASRARLTQWMTDDRVAGALLRTALPPAWAIADKSGAGGHGSRSIVALLRPPGRAPLIVALYLTEGPADLAARDRAIARIGTALRAALEKSGP